MLEKITSLFVRNSADLDFYSSLIKRDDLVFDIGANIGKRTSVFLKLGAKVVCVEPQPDCHQQLLGKYGRNSSVILVNKALGEEEGTGEIAICQEEPTISTMSAKWRAEGRFSKDYQWRQIKKIPVTTLDALIVLYGTPSFCKIDVEGYEIPVLKGLSRSIPLLSFEFTKEFLSDLQEAFAHLSRLGMKEFNFSIGESHRLEASFWLSAAEIYQQLDSIHDESLWGDIYARSPLPSS